MPSVCCVLCRAVPCRAVPCRAVPCRAVPCRAVLCCAVCVQLPPMNGTSRMLNITFPGNATKPPSGAFPRRKLLLAVPYKKGFQQFVNITRTSSSSASSSSSSSYSFSGFTVELLRLALSKLPYQADYELVPFGGDGGSGDGNAPVGYDDMLQAVADEVMAGREAPKRFSVELFRMALSTPPGVEGNAPVRYGNMLQAVANKASAVSVIAYVPPSNSWWMALAPFTSLHHFPSLFTPLQLPPIPHHPSHPSQASAECDCLRAALQQLVDGSCTLHFTPILLVDGSCTLHFTPILVSPPPTFNPFQPRFLPLQSLTTPLHPSQASAVSVIAYVPPSSSWWMALAPFTPSMWAAFLGMTLATGLITVFLECRQNWEFQGKLHELLQHALCSHVLLLFPSPREAGAVCDCADCGVAVAAGNPLMLISRLPRTPLFPPIVPSPTHTPFSPHCSVSHAHPFFPPLFRLPEKPVRTLIARIVLALWLLVTFVVVTSFTANMTSIITVNMLTVPSLDVNSVINANNPIAYQAGSFIEGYLTQLGVQKHNMVPLSSAEEYSSALVTGRVKVVVDEDPYLDLLRTNHCSMAQVKQPYSFLSMSFGKGGGGRGPLPNPSSSLVPSPPNPPSLHPPFPPTQAFQKGSQLRRDISAAILHLTMTGELDQLQQDYLLRGTRQDISAAILQLTMTGELDQLQQDYLLGGTRLCPDTLMPEAPAVLANENFWGLFVGYAVVSLSCCLLYVGLLVFRGAMVASGSGSGSGGGGGGGSADGSADGSGDGGGGGKLIELPRQQAKSYNTDMAKELSRQQAKSYNADMVEFVPTKAGIETPCLHTLTLSHSHTLTLPPACVASCRELSRQQAKSYNADMVEFVSTQAANQPAQAAPPPAVTFKSDSLAFIEELGDEEEEEDEEEENFYSARMKGVVDADDGNDVGSGKEEKLVLSAPKGPAQAEGAEAGVEECGTAAATSMGTATATAAATVLSPVSPLTRGASAIAVASPISAASAESAESAESAAEEAEVTPASPIAQASTVASADATAEQGTAQGQTSKPGIKVAASFERSQKAQRQSSRPEWSKERHARASASGITASASGITASASGITASSSATSLSDMAPDDQPAAVGSGSGSSSFSSTNPHMLPHVPLGRRPGKKLREARLAGSLTAGTPKAGDRPGARPVVRSGSVPDLGLQAGPGAAPAASSSNKLVSVLRSSKQVQKQGQVIKVLPSRQLPAPGQFSGRNFFDVDDDDDDVDLGIFEDGDSEDDMPLPQLK
ncbi:unnamed protein product [Closterium sp. NIES-54]